MSKKRKIIVNAHGILLDRDTVFKHMDQKTLWNLAGMGYGEDLVLIPRSDQEIFDDYCKIYRKKYGEEFKPNTKDPYRWSTQKLKMNHLRKNKI